MIGRRPISVIGDIDIQANLDKFLASIPIERLSNQLALRCGMTEDEAKTFLLVYINEMQTTLGLVCKKIKLGSKILEIGAGLCLFSVFLKTQGYDITALEPSTGGFGIFETAKRVILDAYSNVGLQVWEFPAQELLTCDDKFDLIFSNNVLEHIPNLEEAWSGMCAVLKSEGMMLHNCPNYIFPYEPHLGIPVIKVFPKLSEILFHGAVIQHKEVWESLNFTTYFDVKRLARNSGMKVIFKKELLWSALRRIGEDPLFRKRHSGRVIVSTYTILSKFHLLDLLRLIPPWCATPMIFQCTRSDKLCN